MDASLALNCPSKALVAEKSGAEEVGGGLSKLAKKPVQLVRFSEQTPGDGNGGCSDDTPSKTVVPDFHLAIAAKATLKQNPDGSYSPKTADEMARDKTAYDYVKAWCDAKNNGMPIPLPEAGEVA
jgi:hypothetical protein